jgi:hypothetical protein
MSGVVAFQNLRDRMETGVRRWAAANRSDPFAATVARSHIANGICESRAQLAGQDRRAGELAFYSARPVQRTHPAPESLNGRFSDGTREYTTTEYNNLVRP